jgi:hypothetical protein
MIRPRCGQAALAWLIWAKEVEAGAAYIDRALVLNQNLAASWNASGWVRMYLGESASAIEHFERAMRLSPLDPLTYFFSTGMAFAHAFAGRYDEAISWATKALHEQPNWATALRVAAMPMLFRIGWSKRGRRWPACARSIPR